MRTRAERRHNTKTWKKKAHPAARCGNTRCGICHPHKKKFYGNSLVAIKKKYWPIKKAKMYESSTEES